MASCYIYVLFAISYVSIPLCTGAPMTGLDDAIKMGKAGGSLSDNASGGARLSTFNPRPINTAASTTDDALGGVKGSGGSNALRKGSGSAEDTQFLSSSNKAARTADEIDFQKAYNSLKPHEKAALEAGTGYFDGYVVRAPPEGANLNENIRFEARQVRAYPPGRDPRAQRLKNAAVLGIPIDNPELRAVPIGIPIEGKPTDTNTVWGIRAKNQPVGGIPIAEKKNLEPALVLDHDVRVPGSDDVIPAGEDVLFTRMWHPNVGHAAKNGPTQAPKGLPDASAVKGRPRAKGDATRGKGGAGRPYGTPKTNLDPVIKTRLAKEKSGFLQKIRNLIRKIKTFFRRGRSSKVNPYNQIV